MTRFTRPIGRLALIGVMLFTMVAATLTPGAMGRAQSATPATAEYVPADAVLYIAIDTHVLSTQWLQTAILAQRINPDAQVEAIPRNVLEQAFDRDNGSVDIDVTPFIGGELALVFIGAGALLNQTSPDEIADDPIESAEGLIDGMVVVAVPSDIAAAEAELQRALAEVAETREVGVQTTTYRDYTISFIDGSAADGEAGVAIVAAGDAVAVAFTPGQLESIIDRADGIGESIAEIDGFDAALAPLPDERVVLGVLNGPKLAADGRELDVIGPALEAFIPGGPNAVTAFAVSSEADGFRIDTRTVGTDGQPVRTFGDHLESNLIGNLPAETQVAISGSDLAGTKLLDGVLAIAFNLIFGAISGVFVGLDEPASATPEPLPNDFESVVDQAFALAEGFVGIDLRGDLVDLIDGEFLFGVWNTGGSSADPRIGFVSESSDPQTLAVSINSLTFIAGFFLGTVAATSLAGISEVQIGGGNLELDVVNDRLVIGYAGGGAALTSEPASALVDTERFQTVTAPLPTERSLLIYVDIASLQAGPPTVPRTNTFGLGARPVTGPAVAFAFFNDGDEMGGQGYVYIPEP